MKLWLGYGSEHSMNLVMIGRFRTAADADVAKKDIDRLTEKVQADLAAGSIELGGVTARYSDAMLDFFKEFGLFNIAPVELEQFAYDVKVEIKGSEAVVTTDECDVSAFLKVLLYHGAKVEIFSAHQYPETPETDAS